MRPRLAAVCILLWACLDPNAPGALVPPTVDEDPALPSAEIRVAGKTRQIHVRTFGDPSLPTLMVVHASASDLRFYLPLQVLSDRYHVVLWNMRGNGLSERVPAEELAFRVMAEELLEIKRLYSPDRQVTLIAHSWGAAIAALFMAKHPELDTMAVGVWPFFASIGMTTWF